MFQVVTLSQAMNSKPQIQPDTDPSGKLELFGFRVPPRTICLSLAHFKQSDLRISIEKSIEYRSLLLFQWNILAASSDITAAIFVC